VALWMFGVPIDLVSLPFALLTFAQLFLLGLGFAFLFAALQVFVRDLSPALPQLLMLWMFASPIFYARDSFPEQYRSWLQINPFAHYPESLRASMLHFGSIGWRADATALLVAVCVLVAGWAVFRRLNPHFEDFL